jgi:hypothetical protein
MTRLEEIQAIIDMHDLKQKSRYMHLIYRRYYLYKVLKRDGMTLSQIGVDCLVELMQLLYMVSISMTCTWKAER